MEHPGPICYEVLAGIAGQHNFARIALTRALEDAAIEAQDILSQAEEALVMG